MRYRFVTREVRVGLKRNLTMTLALFVSVAVSLTLLGTALLLSAQVNRMKGFWYDKIEVSIFLCGKNSTAFTCSGNVNKAQREEIQKTLEDLTPTVQEVFYESSTDAYERFKEQFEGSSILANVSPDALPESFRVKIDNPDNFDVVANAVGQMPGVESVQDQRKLLERFFQVLTGLQTFVLAISIAMILVTILLVGNTVRMAAFARRRETAIMRLVGASNSTIRLPFILEAVVAATIGATIASIGMVLAKALLIDMRLAPNLTFIAFVTWKEVLLILPVLYLVGVAIASIASAFALRRHLRV